MTDKKMDVVVWGLTRRNVRDIYTTLRKTARNKDFNVDVFDVFHVMSNVSAPDHVLTVRSANDRVSEEQIKNINTTLLSNHSSEIRDKETWNFKSRIFLLTVEQYQWCVNHQIAGTGFVKTLTIDVPTGTPGSRWKMEGGQHPFPELINLQREKLSYGHLTDFELGNALFLCDHRTSLKSLPLCQAAKDRLRWLSTHLDAALERIAELEGKLENEQTPHDAP